MTTTTNGPGAMPFTEQLGEQLVTGGHRRMKQEARRRRAVRGGIAVTATAAVAGGVFGLLPGGAGSPLGTVDTAAAATLQRASTVAASGPGMEDVEPGQYWYERWQFSSSIVQTDDDLAAAEEAYEDWIGVDGVGAMLRSSSDGESEPFGLLFPPDGTDDLAPGFTEELAGYDMTPATTADGEEVTEHAFAIGHDVGSYADLTALPTDPEQLREALVATMDRGPLDGLPNPLDPGSSLDAALYNSVSEMLGQPLPSELRAALFAVLAGIEGTTQSEVTDQLGRPALAVGRDYPGGEIREELLFDADSREFLGSRTVLLAAGGEYPGEPGDVLAELVLVEAGVVDRVGERP